jgi:hypothetical protein
MASSTEQPSTDVIASRVVQAIFPSSFMTMDIEYGESGNCTASSPYKSHLHESFEMSNAPSTMKKIMFFIFILWLTMTSPSFTLLIWKQSINFYKF